MLAALVAVLVVGAAITLTLVLGDDEDDDRRADPADRSTSADVATSDVDTSNLDAVVTFGELETTHVDDGTDVDYPQSPPVGGRHHSTWLECGVHDEPVPEENVVHDLEHGTVWITYDPEQVDDAEVADLADQLPDNGILSPYPDQDAPVVVTVWSTQLELVGSDDPRLGLFIDTYGAGETAPEPFASCHGGVDPDDLA